MAREEKAKVLKKVEFKLPSFNAQEGKFRMSNLALVHCSLGFELCANLVLF